MPWPPGTLKGESKGGEKKHEKKDKKKDDKGKGGKDDVGKDDAVPTYHQVDRAESVGCPRTLLEATEEYPKAVQSQLLNEYARSTKE
eukprot:s808_g4.t1